MNRNDWADILNGEPTKFFPETTDYQPPSIDALTRLLAEMKDMAGGVPMTLRFPPKTKSPQDRIAEILDSPAFKGALKMMDAEGMAKVAKLLADIDAATKTSQAKIATTGKETSTGAPEGFPWLGEARMKALAEIPPKKEKQELTPEQKIAKREAELKADEYFREKAVRREHPELQLPLEERELQFEREKWKTELEAESKKWKAEFGAGEAARMFNERMTELEYTQNVREAKRQYELDVDKFGEEQAKNKRDYELEKLGEERSWKEMLFDQGFKDKEFIELSKQFWGTLDFNKEKEEIRAREFGQTYTLDVTREANIMERFGETLKREYAQLDLDIKEYGLNVDTEQRIRKLALMNVALKTKELGLEQAAQSFEEREAERKYFWTKKEYELKDKNADRLLRDTEARIFNDVKKTDLATAIHRENIRQFNETMEYKWTELEREAKEEEELGIKISNELSSELANMGSEIQDEVMGYIKSSYDVKKGNWFPSEEQMVEVGNFLFGIGKGETRSKERLGINLSTDEFIRIVLTKYTWPDQLKGWAIRCRDNERCWRGMKDSGAQMGVYISKEGEEPTTEKPWHTKAKETMGGILAFGPTVIKKGLEWRPFGKTEEPEKETEQSGYTGDIYNDATTAINTRGYNLEELRNYLKDIKYSDEEINDLFTKLEQGRGK